MSSRILFETKKLFCSYVYLGTKPLFVTWIITAVSHNRQTSISLSQTLHRRHFLYFASALFSLLYSSSIFSLYFLAYSSTAFSSYAKFLSRYRKIIIFTSFRCCLLCPKYLLCLWIRCVGPKGPSHPFTSFSLTFIERVLPCTQTVSKILLNLFLDSHTARWGYI